MDTSIYSFFTCLENEYNTKSITTYPVTVALQLAILLDHAEKHTLLMMHDGSLKMRLLLISYCTKLSIAHTYLGDDVLIGSSQKENKEVEEFEVLFS